MSPARLPLAVTALALAAGPLHAQHSTHLTLGDAARMAATRSATTTSARARASQADARVGQYRADFLPSLSTGAQAGARTFNTVSLGLDLPTSPGGTPPYDPRGEVSGPVRTVDFRTQVTQRLLDVPALLRWRAASAGADAAHYGADVASEASAERGATAYLQVLRAEARIRAREADSSLASDLLDIARRQVKSGVGIALDVTRADAQLADARARLIGTRSERDRALLQLRHELDVVHDAPLVLADSLAAPAAGESTPDEDDAIRAALARRQDLKAAVAGEERTRLDARAARAERLPTLSAYANQGTTGRDVDRLLGTYQYGVQVTLPLFDGLRIESRQAEQQSRHREAESELRDARRRVETEVRGALLALGAAREQVAATQVRLSLAEQEVAQAQERFRNGVSGSADVITASIALNGARDLAIDALASYHGARVALARAQGGMTTLP